MNSEDYTTDRAGNTQEEPPLQLQLQLPLPLPLHEHEHDDPVLFQVKGFYKVHSSQLRYFTYTIIGVALLWPWNSFLSASAFYALRFNKSPSLVSIYSSTMMSVSTITSMAYNFYLSQKQTGVNYKQRVMTGLNLTIGVSIFMAITCITRVFIDMNDVWFFTILMLMVFLSATATCLAQNGTMAIVNVMGDIYANAVMVGQAIAGVLPSCALIISVLIAGEKTKDAQLEKDYGVFLYYITASLISGASLGLLFLIGRYEEKTLYKELRQSAGEHLSVTNTAGNENGHGFDLEVDELVSVQKVFVPFGQLWSKLKLIVMTIFLTFAITLLFPIFASAVESTNTTLSVILFKKQIYVPFIFLVWNLGDLLGRIACGYPKLRMVVSEPRTLITYSIARVVFIPLFMTCNIHPGKASPMINSDAWYILLQLLFGFSNGQLCTSSFMVVGKHCDTDDEKEAAGGFTTVFLSSGLAVGSVLSYLLVLAIN
ncbi:conserved hypothetical protein [Lodderomyces elongisporus NRRL YB-4239]|uniref:Nucleoside transporter FUN26 n=1 Tax=Lodderomyces elongisporus (strain ATCC 11503 / CBS 2605 / JCM 1781 / NBRC 1676 / NRRL YB-4239) TaxID=379508 RepID=A5E3U3_LODEL|nr:conserved hypothetical protein [Lodderomyces elongisporus NRRL YB-4239]